MKRTSIVMVCMVALLWSDAVLTAQKNGPAKAASRPTSAQSATAPVPKDVPRHEGFLKIAEAGGINLLFIGDSITDGWRGKGKAVWAEAFEPLKAANFGIGGDRTQHVIWRLQNGELKGIQPKLIVLMIGTNNLGGNSDEEIAAGVKVILDEIHQRSPASKTLLLGIFPRAADAKNTARARIKAINAEIAKFADDKSIYYMDIGEKFLGADGSLPKDVMPDQLHPNEKGYQIWADAILPRVKELLGD